MATEKELDRALAEELETNPAFLSWFMSHTTFSGSGAVFHSCRSDHPWGTHPFQQADGQGQNVVTQRQSETDILLNIRDRNGRILGVHIENKVGAGKFTNFQAEMYPQRAAHWVGNERYGAYEHFDTVLVAPEAFRQRNAEQAALFGAFISHEAVARHISLFAEPAGAAENRGQSTIFLRCDP